MLLPLVTVFPQKFIRGGLGFLNEKVLPTGGVGIQRVKFDMSDLPRLVVPRTERQGTFDVSGNLLWRLRYDRTPILMGLESAVRPDVSKAAASVALLGGSVRSFSLTRALSKSSGECLAGFDGHCSAIPLLQPHDVSLLVDEFFWKPKDSLDGSVFPGTIGPAPVERQY